MRRCRPKKNWVQCNQALVNRGSIIFWVEKNGLDRWYAKQGNTRGRQKIYSDQAIIALLIIRVVYRTAFRQLQGLMRDILSLMHTGLICPDYSTICRRAKSLRVPLPVYRQKGPLHVVFDSTGLKIFGEGEWLRSKWRSRTRRGWRKIHVGICAKTQQIVVAGLTNERIADCQMLPEMLEGIKGEVEEVIGDGAYDTGDCYRVIHRRGGRETIPPREGAKKSPDPELVDRNKAIARIRDQKRGKKCWKKERDYHRRSLVETTMHRLKTVTGDKLQARLWATQRTELAVKLSVLNVMMAELKG